MASTRTRRTTLRTAALLAAGSLGGCQASAGFPTVSVSPEAVPVAYASVTPEVVRQPDARAPAKIRVTFTNTSDATRRIRFSGTPPFAGYFGDPLDGQTDQALLIPLHSTVHVETEIPGMPPPPTVIPESATDGCWQAEANISLEPVTVPRTLEPGASLVGEYALLARPDEGACPLDGRYHFDGQVFTAEHDAWGFTATVRRP